MRTAICLMSLLLLFGGTSFSQAADSLSYDIVNPFFDRLEPKYRTLWLGIGYSYNFVSSTDIYGTQEFVATFGGFAEKSQWVQYFGSYMHLPAQRTIKPSFPIRNGISFVQMGIEKRSYTPEEHAFISDYFSIGAGFGLVYWNYSAPMGLAVPANSFEYTFCSDFHLGFGFMMGRSDALNSEIIISPGVIVFLLKTVHDYPSTILPPMLYLKCRVSLSAAVINWQERNMNFPNSSP